AGSGGSGGASGGSGGSAGSAGSGGGTSAGSCAGHCGKSTPAPGSTPACYCDSSCSGFGDCCADYAAKCGG
ncbi:MAG: ferritin-like domain-containing protein, partial [Polyangiaceae bacterium]|nr:ferritin-like domain-containing protein [Polyangiaceae bacterium]